MAENIGTRLKQLVGKRVEWEYDHDYNRGTCSVGQGTVDAVEGKNIWVNGDAMWGPDLINIHEVEIGE